MDVDENKNEKDAVESDLPIRFVVAAYDNTSTTKVCNVKYLQVCGQVCNGSIIS